MIYIFGAYFCLSITSAIVFDRQGMKEDVPFGIFDAQRSLKWIRIHCFIVMLLLGPIFQIYRISETLLEKFKEKNG